MMRARNAPRMPPDRPLDESDIRLVQTWILNGARRHETDTAPLVEGGAPMPASDAGAHGDGAGDVTASQ
jgi:hypothetical protein